MGALSIQHADPDVGKGTTDNSDGEDDDDVHDPDRPEEFEFDHAINYVTCIKRRFAHEPETYKAFLDILHSYQRQREHTSEFVFQVSPDTSDCRIGSEQITLQQQLCQGDVA